MEQITPKEINYCKVCGSKDLSLFLQTRDYFLTQENFDLLKCNNCDYIFTTPEPNEKELFKYYDSSEYLSHHRKTKTLTAIIYNFIRSVNISNKYKFVSQFKSGKTILDYGCGTGLLLNYFQNKNWVISGYEPDAKARKLASDLCKIEILSSENIKTLEKSKFDVITLWHVLEHISDLNETLSFLVSLLNENGIIIIAVPNINSPDAVRYGKYWAGLDVPRHLSHFSPNTISELFSRHSLDLIQTSPMKFDSFYVSLLSEKYKGNRLPYFSAIKNGVLSNIKAKKTTNYSSIIFVATHN